MSEKQISLRIDGAVLSGIDARAKQVGLSRNEWIERCCRWAIHNLPERTSQTSPTVNKFMDSAPPEVAGKQSIDMGLDMPEGK